MSFDSLPLENVKEIFKHIACIFLGMDIDSSVTILDACDIEAGSGITNLINRGVLSIRWNKELTMYQLVQEMGTFLIRNLVALEMSYRKIESFGISCSYPRLLKRLKQCPELVLIFLIDLSYCNKLEKPPKSLGMIKKVKILFRNGCYLDSTVYQAMPSYSKFFVIFLPISLVSLSFKNNNLCTKSFPLDFSCLTMLKELYLDKNPIVSLPNFLRCLPRLETLR
uniref:Disease resistance protein Roq1-like winged-helix domain-containing protein n=1 Tax=Lactuca sativa TaxID=4236 RepID=A0A9R1WKA4_LACSA|nr:hypothetical protein LSAT_V11C100040490 [Lactuca sativa]